MTERRKLREEYAQRWTGGLDLVKSTKAPLSRQFVERGNAAYFGNGHLAIDPVERNGLTFLRIPPPASQKPVEGWNIPPFAYDIVGYAAYPPENVIAVAERGEKCVTGSHLR